jgi:hypothetical protein
MKQKTFKVECHHCGRVAKYTTKDISHNTAKNPFVRCECCAAENYVGVPNK